jgi:phage-related protein
VVIVKPCFFVGSARKDIQAFPPKVKSVIGAAIQAAQYGGKSAAAKPMKGMGSGVVEVVDNFDNDTYRSVYIVRLEGAVYVLHAFKKKSVKGIKTAQKDIELIKSRIKLAEEHHAKNRTN